MKAYLQSTEVIDWDTPDIATLARNLSDNSISQVDVAKHCFEWVRDNIKHSWDYQLNPVTYTASDVLKSGTGFCYAKSHLLAALLRANRIPAGLCYQRLSVNDNGAPYCLHGLNAVFLPDTGWYRIDARGNKEGVNAQFKPPNEQLAFVLQDENEIDFEAVLAEPLPAVIDVLRQCKTVEDVYYNLPDAETIP